MNEHIIITDIHVHRNFRNKGYGSSLIYIALRYENKKEAHVLPRNSAYKFYLKIGFEKSKISPHYLIGNLEKVENYVKNKEVEIFWRI